jgi:hypothetical protein
MNMEPASQAWFKKPTLCSLSHGKEKNTSESLEIQRGLHDISILITLFLLMTLKPTIRNLPTSGLDSGSSWLDGVNGILMQQEPDSPKQDYWNRRAIASLANTLITVMEPVPTPLLSSMPLLQL